jgi:hypothetical protein
MDEDSSLLACDAISTGKKLAMFWTSLLLQSLRSQQPTTWPAYTRSTEAQSSSEMPVRIYKSTRPQLFKEDMDCSDHEGGGRELLWTARNHIPIGVASYARKHQSSAVGPCEKLQTLEFQKRRKIWQDKRLLASQEESDLRISLAPHLKTK